MKKTIILSLSMMGILPVFSQVTEDWAGIPILMDAYGHQITRDGVFSTGEAVSVQGAWGRNNVTGDAYFWDGGTVGYGNAVSKNLTVVGTDKEYMQGSILHLNGESELIQPMAKYSDSYAYAISWDGSRICGIVANPRDYNLDEDDPNKMSMMYLPVVCEYDEATGQFGELTFLKAPQKDFFGMTPQYCTAVHISDDGKTILGQVVDNSGFYVYPIVYIQDENGDWDYIEPSKPLFNPDNLEIPKYPVPEMEPPQAQDYITNPEKKELFEKMLEDYQNNPQANPDPFDILNPAEAGDDALMTQQEWNQYQQALKEYNFYNINVFQPLVDQYYVEYNRFMATTKNFLQSSMAMNFDGTKVSQTIIEAKYDNNRFIHYNIPIIFDLVKGDYQIYDSEEMLQVTQILSDGTLIAITPRPSGSTNDETPQYTLVCPPGKKTFVELPQYIKESNPEVYSWMEKYLFHHVPVDFSTSGDFTYKDMFVTGHAAVSDDFTAMSGGVDAWSWDLTDGFYFTYFFTGMETPAGIEELKADPQFNGLYKVYNLHGMKVLETKEASDLNSLGKGIYIINGKKVAI